jgi:phosphopantetheinyl transferase
VELNANAPPALAPGDIHIWPLDAGGPEGAAYHAAADRLLSTDEKQRAAALTRPPARSSYVAARAHMRTVLARYTALPARALPVEYNNAGKPLLAGIAGAPAFNLSHSGQKIVLAVSDAALIGADIEPLARAERILRVARAAFTPTEAQTLNPRGPTAADKALMMWCFKESAVKARGQTVWDGLTGIQVSLRGVRATLAGDDQLHLIGGQLSGTHFLALAVAAETGTLRVRCLTPDGASDHAAFVPQFWPEGFKGHQGCG